MIIKTTILLLEYVEIWHQNVFSRFVWLNHFIHCYNVSVPSLVCDGALVCGCRTQPSPCSPPSLDWLVWPLHWPLSLSSPRPWRWSVGPTLRSSGTPITSSSSSSSAWSSTASGERLCLRVPGFRIYWQVPCPTVWFCFSPTDGSCEDKHLRASRMILPLCVPTSLRNGACLAPTALCQCLLGTLQWCAALFYC